MAAAAMRKSLIIPGILALAGLAVLLGLGTWQVERKAWKENLIETLTDRLHAEPVELPPAADWPQLTQAKAEFTRVRLNVSFPNAGDSKPGDSKPGDSKSGDSKSGDALVYTSGSALRDDVKGIGYFVFAPATLPGGHAVVVNRGFAADRSYPRPQRAQQIVGVLRWPESPSPFVSDSDSSGATWFVRDHLAMARALGWGEVAPFYIEQEGPVPPGGVPHPSTLNVRLRNDHLQYAVTWYSLAGVLVVMWVLWVRRVRRDAATSAGSSPALRKEG